MRKSFYQLPSHWASLGVACLLVITSCSHRTSGGQGAAGQPSLQPTIVGQAESERPLDVTLTLENSQELSLAIVKWDFGDGESDEQDSTPLHHYSKGGIYHVTVHYTRSDGIPRTLTEDLTLNDPPSVTIVKAQPLSGSDTETISFEASAQDSDSKLDAKLCRWDFGDGSTGKGAKPQHAYSGPGLFIVTAMVFDPEGAVGLDNVSVDVKAPAPPSNPPPAPTKWASSIDELQAQIQSAQPGDVIALYNGTYPLSAAHPIAISNKQGQDSNPITIQAEDVGGVVLTGEGGFLLDHSSYIVVKGFTINSRCMFWKDTKHRYTFIIHSSDHITVTRNHFEPEEPGDYPYWLFVDSDSSGKRSEHVEIDHNMFANKHEIGSFIVVEGDKGDAKQIVQFMHIHHNHFKNVIGFDAAGDKEAVRFGSSSLGNSSGFAVIEYNLFESCDGEDEILSIKACDNTIRYNTFKNSLGNLVFRHGDRNIAEGNFFMGDGKEKSGGIRLYGDDHLIINNYLEQLKGSKANGPLVLGNGVVDKNGDNKQNRVDRCTFAFNTLVNCESGLQIGYDHSGDFFLGVRDSVVAYNVVYMPDSPNTVVENLASNTSVEYVGNVFWGKDYGAAPSAGFIATDPELDFEHGLGKLLESSPCIDMANSSTYADVAHDVEGRDRQGPKDAGCNEYSAEAGTRRPLGALDVGP